jgi:hypothetical protein
MFSELRFARESENTGLCSIVRKCSLVIYDLRMHLRTLLVTGTSSLPALEYRVSRTFSLLVSIPSLQCPSSMVSEEESAFSHGRIPAHEVRGSMEVALVLLDAKAAAARHRARLN